MHRTPGGCPDPTWMSQFTLGEAAQPKVKRTHSEASPPGLNPDFSTYWLCSLRSFKSVLCMSVSFPVHARMQTCLILCDPIDCSPPGSSVHGDSPGKNTGVGCHALLQGMDLPNLGVKPRSPTLQMGSLPSEPPGKPPKIEMCYFPSSYRQNSDF